MRKKLTALMMGLLMAGSGLVTTGCYGEFLLVKKVYEFNGTIGGNDQASRVLQSILMVIGSPIYALSAGLDALIFNSVEFWSGSNPLAMKEGEQEQQTVCIEGRTVQITATANRFDMVELRDGQPVDHAVLTYDPARATWQTEQDGAMVDLLTVVELNEQGGTVLLHDVSGNRELMAFDASGLCADDLAIAE
ncbi:MAG: DUF3332 family protein, partial [Bacteroidota bacterium]